MGRTSNRIAAETGDAPGGVVAGEREPMNSEAASAAARQRIAAAQARAMAQEAGVEEATQAPAPAGPLPRRRPRGDRVPFGSSEQQLAHPPIPGFRLYWFNATPGRIERALKAGYVHVTNQRGENLSRNVGRGEGNQNGLTAFLMKIPQEWYEEDMKASQDELEDKLHDISTGQNQGENQYVTTRHKVTTANPR